MSETSCEPNMMCDRNQDCFKSFLASWLTTLTEIAPYTAEIAFLAGAMQWSHRDPFDRMIAATAMALGCPLISKDAAFDGLDGLPEWHGRIWDAASLPAET